MPRPKTRIEKRQGIWTLIFTGRTLVLDLPCPSWRDAMRFALHEVPFYRRLDARRFAALFNSRSLPPAKRLT